MAEKHAKAVPASWGRRLTRLLLEVVKRGYALGVIVLVAWLSYGALHYLVVTLMYPTAVPEQLTGVPTRLDGWLQPDPVNDCARSGCHSPFPHSGQKETRAFLNMHATSLHCGVCHMTEATTPLPLVWYDLRSGAATDTPALLDAFAWVTGPAGAAALETPTAEAQTAIVGLLRTALRQSDGDPNLERLVARLAGPRFSSPEFRAALEDLRAALPRFFRGEYGAKLALRGANGQPVLGHPDTASAVRDFLARGADADAATRDELLARVHPRKRPAPLDCTACHQADGDRVVDLGAAGYPPARRAMLEQGWVVTAVQNMRDGRPLYLPGFVTPEHEGPPPSPPEEPTP